MNPYKKLKKNYTKIPTKLNNLPNLSNEAFRLYSLMCGWEEFFFSYKKISEHTGMVNRQTAKAIKELVNLNMITYEPGYGFNKGKTKSNSYSLVHFDEWITPSLQYTSERASSTPVRAALVHQRETINNKLNNKLKAKCVLDHDSLLREDVKKARVVREVEETESIIVNEDYVTEIVSANRDKPYSVVINLLQGKTLPAIFNTLCAVSYIKDLGNIQLEDLENLKNIAKGLGTNSDEMVRIVTDLCLENGI